MATPGGMMPIPLDSGGHTLRNDSKTRKSKPPSGGTSIQLHSILTPQFDFNDVSGKIIARLKSGKPSMDPIDIEMKQSSFETLSYGYILLSGNHVLHDDWTDSLECIKYSYRIDNKREDMPAKQNEHRLLRVQDHADLSSRQAEVIHQYDYPIYKDRSKLREEEVGSKIGPRRVSQEVFDAEIALLTYLKQFKGFEPSAQENISPDRTVNQISHILNCLGQAQVEYTYWQSDYAVLARQNTLKPDGFDTTKVLMHHLKPILDLYENDLEADNSCRAERQIISAMSIVLLLNERNLSREMPDILQRKLCLGLKFPRCTSKEKCFGLMAKITSVFRPRNADDILVAIIQNMADTSSDWLLILPLLHLLRGNSIPFGQLNVELSDETNLKWWGVEGLNRIPNKGNAIVDSPKAIMETIHHLAPLFKIDGMVVRSVLWEMLSPTRFIVFLKNKDIKEHVSPSLLFTGLKVILQELNETSTEPNNIFKLIELITKQVQERPCNVQLDLLLKAVQTFFDKKFSWKMWPAIPKLCVLFTTCYKQKTEENTSAITSMLQTVVKMVDSWATTQLSKSNLAIALPLADEIQMRNEIFHAGTFLQGTEADEWNSILKTSWIQRIKEVNVDLTT